MNIEIEDVPQDAPQVTQTTRSADHVEHLVLTDRFNIGIPTKEQDEQLQTVWSYIKQQGEERPISDLIWEVINLEQTIGAPKLGESRLDKLYRYVKLRIQEARIKEQLKDVSSPVNIYR